MNTMLGNMRHNAAHGLITGLHLNSQFVTRIKPLYLILEKETKLFCELKGFKVLTDDCPNITHSFRAEIEKHLDQIDDKYPGVKNGIVKSFLEILPTLKEFYSDHKLFSVCSRCGDPCSGEICNTCLLEKQIFVT
jgi:uncharacterized protein (TIGR00269 family)